jgi:hypothetical protein
MTDAHLVGDTMTVTSTSGSADAGELCAQWNVALNSKVGGWVDPPIGVEVNDPDDAPLSHLNVLSMRCS